MMRVWRLSDVSSVAYIGPKSRIKRPRKTKIGTEVAHVTRDSQWRRQLVGTWARAPLAFKRIFFARLYVETMSDLVWYYAKLLTQHYNVQPYSLGNDTI